MNNSVTKSFSKAKKYRCKTKSLQSSVKFYKQSQHRKVRRNVNQQLQVGNEIIKEIRPLSSWAII